MMPPSLQQRCWNHQAREAVCRCPGCGRSFCRECVSEHESRLLCAGCLRGLGRDRRPGTRGMRRVAPLAWTCAGILLAWVILFAVGEAMLTFHARLEQTQWRDR